MGTHTLPEYRSKLSIVIVFLFAMDCTTTLKFPVISKRQTTSTYHFTLKFPVGRLIEKDDKDRALHSVKAFGCRDYEEVYPSEDLVPVVARNCGALERSQGTLLVMDWLSESTELLGSSEPASFRRAHQGSGKYSDAIFTTLDFFESLLKGGHIRLIYDFDPRVRDILNDYVIPDLENKVQLLSTRNAEETGLSCVTVVGYGHLRVS
jgi:hypothetical protein